MDIYGSRYNTYTPVGLHSVLSALVWESAHLIEMHINLIFRPTERDNGEGYVSIKKIESYIYRYTPYINMPQEPIYLQKSNVHLRISGIILLPYQLIIYGYLA